MTPRELPWDKQSRWLPQLFYRSRVKIRVFYPMGPVGSIRWDRKAETNMTDVWARYDG